MKKIVPFFELNGQTYEIKPTRYLLAEYDKISEQSGLSAEEKANAVKAQSFIRDLQKYAEKLKELEEKYFETFDDDDERKYLKCKSLYEQKFEEFTVLELENGSTEKLQKAGIDALEKIAIKGLAEQYFNFDELKAKEIWEKHVDRLQNKETAVEWLGAMAECLFAEEENGDDSFLSQMRKRAEEKSLNRKDYRKAK